ncbi:hypothetical protein F3566_23660 [Salmonella enterica subsp. enterica]|nr:hypothetical protein [Salmonella enterica subsp. enterica serovar Muenster]EDX1126063.1 hypothetical protein [Salmonella enterica]ECB0232620.1 hypothetical protein [Salmonella enterica subsp. enterica serovar Muenster]ECW7982636.1 hypothetical protein [Salmonella enterica subsp. enterica serovar Muenster]ECW7983101.1 hypothetical protein [Salmonella enterica subsp. enterica serovar Muenster]
MILFHYGESWNLLRADQRLIFAKSWPRASRYQQGHQDLFILRSDLPSQVFIRRKVFHTIVSIKNDGHYFCRAGGNRPDGLNEPVTLKMLKRLMYGRAGFELLRQRVMSPLA